MRRSNAHDSVHPGKRPEPMQIFEPAPSEVELLAIPPAESDPAPRGEWTCETRRRRGEVFLMVRSPRLGVRAPCVRMLRIRRASQGSPLAI